MYLKQKLNDDYDKYNNKQCVNEITSHFKAKPKEPQNE